MHTNWIKFLDTINETIQSFEVDNSDLLYFRGHSNKNYELIPTLLRGRSDFEIGYLEQALFYDFVSLAGEKIAKDDTWEILFKMRHYGIPTRLLDWTTSFAHSLYFALSAKELEDPHIWILQPYTLSEKNKGLSPGLINPNYDFQYDYVKMFVNVKDYPKIYRPEYPTPLYPARNNPRIFAQQGVFTIHGTKSESLEKLAPNCLKKVSIPMDCINDAYNFLTLSGIHEYSIYPDFFGLANYLRTKHSL